MCHLVQELCASDLSKLLAASYGALPPAVVKALMQQLLRALGACHAAGARAVWCGAWLHARAAGSPAAERRRPAARFASSAPLPPQASCTAT